MQLAAEQIEDSSKNITVLLKPYLPTQHPRESAGLLLAIHV
jgi:hypothetical protein